MHVWSTPLCKGCLLVFEKGMAHAVFSRCNCDEKAASCLSQSSVVHWRRLFSAALAQCQSCPLLSTHSPKQDRAGWCKRSLLAHRAENTRTFTYSHVYFVMRLLAVKTVPHITCLQFSSASYRDESDRRTCVCAAWACDEPANSSAASTRRAQPARLGQGGDRVCRDRQRSQGPQCHARPPLCRPHRERHLRAGGRVQCRAAGLKLERGCVSGHEALRPLF